MKKLFVLIIATMLISCQPNKGAGSSNLAPLPQAVVFKPQGEANPNSIKALAKSHDAFAMDLFDQLTKSKKDQNIFCSPMSVSTALSLAYVGAKSNTAAQIRKALHYTLDDDELVRAYGHYQKQLLESEEGVEINVVNSIFAQQSYPWSKIYEQKIANNYPSQLYKVDFVNNANAERERINNWVADNTKKRIKDLLAPDDVDKTTRTVLVNAITFDGQWQTAFDEQETYPQSFSVTEDKEVEVQMMNAQGTFLYLSNDTVDMGAIPYKNNKAKLYLIVPQYDVALSDVEAMLSEKFEIWKSELEERRFIKIELPKVNMTFRTDMKQNLSALGIKDAWQRGVADFNGMVDSEEKIDLYFSKVIHKAFIKWDEKGTEAAAATAISVSKSLSRDPGVYCDKPFLFVIEDTSTNSILFMGRVYDPSKKE